MITIDLDNKFAIVSDSEVLNLVQKDGKIQYFTKNKNGWEPVKFEDGSSIPPKGLLQYKPSPFEIETPFSVN